MIQVRQIRSCNRNRRCLSSDFLLLTVLFKVIELIIILKTGSSVSAFLVRGGPSLNSSPGYLKRQRGMGCSTSGNTSGSGSSNSVNYDSSKSKDFLFPQPELSANSKMVYEGKNIMLTGASSGLGAAMALHLSTCNVHHLLLSGRNMVALREVAQQCEKLAAATSYFNKPLPTVVQTKVHILPCDLADLKAVQEMADLALTLTSSAVDILINCGGISSRSKFLDTSIDVDELLMKVNFLSGAALAKKLVPGMISQGGGKIIWISSIQGKLGIPLRTSYAASKFAVQGYCESLRSELTSTGVSVHIISPGYIRTSLSQNAMLGSLGQTYQKMDETTAQGADPLKVSSTILVSVARGQADVIVAASFTARIAIWLRFFFPSLLRSMLVKRFLKSQQNKQQIDSISNININKYKKSE
jgi:dehydrogenase/reductase SDR family protein 7B